MTGEMWRCSIILLLAVFGRNAQCESTLDDKYFLGKDWLSYSQAVQSCQSRSMKLISIENKNKNEEVSELMRQKDIRGGCWTSGRILPDRRSWVWLDGKPFQFQSWNPSRKHLLNHVLTDNCITVARHRGHLYWDDQFCQNLRCYICEYPSSDCNKHRIRIRVDDHLNATNTGASTPRRKEFFVSTTRATYQQALDSCQAMSMELVSIYNVAENDEIGQLLSQESANFFTSGHKNSSRDPWQWSRGENITYQRWRAGEPNNARRDEFCIFVIRLNDGLRWLDHTCNEPYRYICQRVLPQVDIIVNGNDAVRRGSTNATTRVPSQTRPLQVFVDVESAVPMDTSNRIVWNYYISDDKVPQSDAIRACRNRSQHLLTIENENKNELVFDLLERNQVRGVYWTSATRNSTKSSWVWSDGDPVTYFSWGLRSSNSTEGRACIEVHKTEMDVTWSDLPCTESRQYICETTDVYSLNRAGGILLNISYDNDLVYTNDSTMILTHK